MELIEKVQDLIDKWDIVGLNSELQNDKHIPWLEENAWDMIPTLVEPATEQNLAKCPQVVHACSKLLSETVAQHGKPKEIIISILEQCEYSGSSVRFIHCLPAIQTSLLKLDSKGASLTWHWALSTIVGHVNGLELPDIPEIEGQDDRLVLEHDQVYADRLQMIEAVADLLKSLTFKYDAEFQTSPFALKVKGTLVWSCVMLLAKPLSFMNICDLKGLPTSAKKISDSLMKILNCQIFNHLSLIDPNQFSDMFKKISVDDKILWSHGIGQIFYNHFTSPDPQIPLCYDPLYLFYQLLFPICNMLEFQPGLSSSDYLRHEKGLILTKSLICRIPLNVIPLDVMEKTEHTYFISKMYQITIYHNMASVRKLGYEAYNSYFDTFGQEISALKFLVNHALAKANHSGIIAHAIGKLKNALLRQRDGQILKGAELHKLVKQFCQIKNGAETDLLEVSDEIMASLNFLIAIFLRDKLNEFGLWDIIPELNRDFLEPLSRGLSLSRGHYKLKLQEPKSAEVTLMVGGEVLPEMSREQKNEVINSALNTFDMMDCVLGQLNNIITNRRK